MPASTGQNLYESGLVFGYDITDNKTSFLGKPTTNYISNPTEEMARGEFGQYRDLAPTFDTHGLVPYSLSMDIKANKPGGVYVYMQNGSSSRYGFVGSSINATMEYQRFYFDNITPYLATPSDTAATLATYTGYGSGVNPTVRNIQLEKGTYSTPFVNGTRSNTQSLVDLAGNSTINVSSVSFNSSGKITFDGTDDSLVISNVPQLKNDRTSLEFVIKYNATPNGDIIQFGVGSGSYAQYYYRAYSGYSYWNWYSANSLGYSEIAIPNGVFGTGSYKHVVMTGDSYGQLKFYVNGVQQGGSTWTRYSTPASWTPASLTVGGFTWDGYSNSDIPYLKIYNRVLLDSEITSHFNQVKTKFSIQ